MAKLWQVINMAPKSDEMIGEDLNEGHIHAKYAYLTDLSHRRSRSTDAICQTPGFRSLVRIDSAELGK
jgi:hypothetical protein